MRNYGFHSRFHLDPNYRRGVLHVIKVSIDFPTLEEAKDFALQQQSSGSITDPIIIRCQRARNGDPKTFAYVVCRSLSVHDEHELYITDGRIKHTLTLSMRDFRSRIAQYL